MEVAIVLPILLLLFTATFEYSASLRIVEATEFFSWQTANEAFRECRAVGNDTTLTPAQNTVNLQGCFTTKVVTPLLYPAGLAYPKVKIIVSRYEWEAGGVVLRASYGACPGTAPPSFNCSTYQSRYDATKAAAAFGSVIQDASAMLIAEIYVVDSSPIRIVGAALPGPGYYYGSAVL